MSVTSGLGPRVVRPDGPFPEALFRPNKLTPNRSNRSFTIESHRVNVGSMLTVAKQRLAGRIDESMGRLYTSPIWGQSGHKNIFNAGTTWQCFDIVSGSIRLPDFSKLTPSAAHLRNFFCKPGRLARVVGRWENRGARYYLAADDSKDVLTKLSYMAEDIRDGLCALQRTNRKSLDAAGFLYYLGVLDYLKVHTLTAYNALTFEERHGKFQRSANYQILKGDLLRLAIDYTSAYYECLVGRDLSIHEAGNRIPSGNTALACFERMKEQTRLTSRCFKLQEVDHPLVIGLNAHENALRYPETDVVLGLPFGGLQPAIATLLALRLANKNDRAVLVPVPVSTHSGRDFGSLHLMPAQIQELVQEDVIGKRVLVVEDNTNTGKTLQVVSDGIQLARPRSLHFSIVELDARRTTLKQSGPKPHPWVANLVHPDLEPLRIVPIRTRPSPQDIADGRIGTQMMKLRASLILRNERRSWDTQVQLGLIG